MSSATAYVNFKMPPDQASPTSAHISLGWLQHAIDIAIRDWGIPLRENVVKRVRRPRIDNRRERRLRLGEWERLIRAAHECGNALMPPLLVLALETGMRRGELLSMRWRDFDSGRRTVTLSQTKNGHPRKVPLTPLAFDTLSALPHTEDRCVPMSDNAVLLAFTRLRRRAGVDDITFHDLRHEAVSRFVERGLSLAEVQMISGHRDLRMLMRYTHLAVGDIVAKLHSVA